MVQLKYKFYKLTIHFMRWKLFEIRRPNIPSVHIVYKSSIFIKTPKTLNTPSQAVADGPCSNGWI